MRGASRESMTAAQDRLRALLSQPQVEAAAVGDEFFELSNLLDGQPALRAALTDPARSGDEKAALVRSLLGGKLSDEVVEFIEGTVRSRWSANRDLVHAADALAAESVLSAAEHHGQLDDLEDELFRFSRLIAAEPSLRAALTDRALPAERKAQVVATLLEGKVSAEALRLATRTVTHPRGLSLEAGLSALADQAAARRQRLVATVIAAVPLTQSQREQLSASLTRQFGHEVHLNVVIDESVIGGVRVSLGEEVIDGTVAARIDDARRRILG